MAEYQKTPAQPANEGSDVRREQPDVTYAPTVQSQTTTLAGNPAMPPSFIEKVEPAQDSGNDPHKGMIEPVHQPQFVTPLSGLDETPAWVDCPFCQRRTETRVEHTDSGTTTMAGVLCCLICICFACIPCLAGWCQNTEHYCKECNKKLTYRPYDGSVTVMTAQNNTQVPSQYGVAGRQQQATQPNQGSQPASSPQLPQSVQQSQTVDTQPPAYSTSTK